jgi:hypothetical protein
LLQEGDDLVLWIASARPETFNDPPQAEYSCAIGSSLQLRNRPRVETTTRTLGVQTTRGVAVAPDVFSFFSPKKEPGAEPRASSVDQASTAETPGRLEFEVFEPHTTFFEPTPIEINRREERVVGLEARIQKVAEPDQPLAPGQTNVGRLDEGAFGAMTTQLEGVLAGFGDQMDRIAAGLAEADRLAAVVSGVETRIATLEEREHSLTHAADRIAPGLAEADRLAAVVSGVETRIATLEEREHSLTHAADRIAPGLAEADRLATVVSGVETRIATLLEREQSLTHTAARIAAGLTEADRLAAVVSGVETRIATLEERGHSLTHSADRIAPGLAEADRLATVVSGVETRIATLEEREHSLTHAADRIAPGLAEAARLAELVSGVEIRIATLLEREQSLTQTAARIAAGLAEADRLAAVVSGVETRIATLEEREHSLTHAADRIAPGLAEADRLATVVSGVETRIATLLEREHSLTQAAERIGPGLAEADRLAAVVSGVELRITTLLEREHLLTQAAERIAAGLAEADRLAAVVSGVETRLAALLAREHSLTQAAEPIVGQALHDRADEPAAPFPLVSVDAGGSNGDGSRLGEPKRTIGRLAVATGVVGILALVVVGSGLAARWARPPVQAAVTQHKSEAHIATAASSPVPSPAVDVPIPPVPTPLATAAPTTPRVIPAATKSASRKATSSKAATQHRARRPQPAGREPSAPPVFVGALAVQSNPAGGTVFLDRQRVGETPLQLTGVTAGAHAIWIESPGHARWTAAVQVNTNKLVKVSATLEPRR